MGVYTGSGPTDPVVGNKVSVTAFGVPTSDAVQALASAWSSYTPTITGFTLGNGTVAGAYTQVGKIGWFRASLTFGSTTAAASSGCIFSLPFTVIAAMAGSSFTAGLSGGYVDTGTGAYTAHCRWESTTTAGLYIIGTNGVRTNFSTTSPFTWTTGDTLNIAGFAEVA